MPEARVNGRNTMPYTTIDDLSVEFSQSELAKLTGDKTGAVINEAIIDMAAEEAAALIDANLVGAYDVPFSLNAPPLIKKISLDLTAARLFEIAYARIGVPGAIVIRKNTAEKTIEKLKKGDIVLPGRSPCGDAPPAIVSNLDNRSRIFDDAVRDAFSEE